MLERRNVMQRNSRALGSEDFDRFSKFLRSTPSRAMPCNSENRGESVANNNNNQSNNNHTSPYRKSLAMVYAQKQNWQSIYDPEIALYNGTVFEELHKPFEMSGCSQNNGCRGNTREGGCFL